MAIDQIQLEHIAAEFLLQLTPLWEEKKPFPGPIPMPAFKEVAKLGARWLAQCKWVLGEKNTTIEFLKGSFDENTLRRILAHELIHHLEDLTVSLPLWNKSPREYRERLRLEKRIYQGHGPFFLKRMAELNTVYGAEFVTLKSDTSYSFKADRSALVLLKKPTIDEQSMIGWAYSVQPSSSQLAYIRKQLAEDTKGFLKLVRSTDIFICRGARIGQGFAILTHDKNGPHGTHLNELWEFGEAIPLNSLRQAARPRSMSQQAHK